MNRLNNLAKAYQRLGNNIETSSVSNVMLDKMSLLLDEGVLPENASWSNSLDKLLHETSIILQQLHSAPNDHNTIKFLHYQLYLYISNCELNIDHLDTLSCVYQRVHNSGYDYQYLLDKIENIL